MNSINHYIFKECVEAFVELNNAEFALGFVVSTTVQPNFVYLDTKVVINSLDLPEKDVIKLTRHLERNFFEQACTEEALFFDKNSNLHNSNVLNNKNINNIRYVPIKDALGIYAVILLINVKLSEVTQKLPDITSLVASSLKLFEHSVKENELYPVKVTPKKNISNNKKAVESLLKNTFHPTFIFNDEFKVLKANSASQKLFHSNIERGWPTMDKLLEKSIPSVATALLNTINKYGFLGHLNKEQWCDVNFEHNSYQSVKVDIQLFEIEYLGTQCFGLMLNEKYDAEITAQDYFSSLQRFNALTSVVPMAILQLDKNWRCSYVNETWGRYTGQNIKDSKDQGWLYCLHQSDIQEILPTIQRVTFYAKNYTGEIQLKRIDQSNLWVSINAIGLFNDKCELTGFILTLHDISESYLHAEKLEKMANYDHLTGLSNRSFFNDRLAVALSRSSRHGITALMFLDLDKFKNINDTLGHPVGDKVIQEVASRLASTVRNEDTIARLGGDEFAIIFTDIKTIHVLASIAQKIVDAVHLPFSVDDHPIAMSCSIGIAMTDEDKMLHTPTDMLNKADLALYKAKELGRNQFYFYDSQLEHNITMLNRLRESLNNPSKNEFTIVFQPQVNIHSNQISGFEVLSRWNNDILGHVGPDTFIKLVEDNNLIYEFSLWLFNEAIKTVSQWVKVGLIKQPQRVAINLSAKQLHFHDFSEQVIELFASKDISPTWFTLEVTETAFIEDPTIAGRNLKKLQKAGFLIALDDFGTGYSSLNLLRRMPLDYIKIDRSFIKDVLSDDDSAKIVKAIIGLCKMLNLGVIAEGVENAPTKDWLIANDCYIHQGYYFNRPLTKTDTQSLLLNAAALATIAS
ncbi:EAL domain-containing protein [Colwellia sp. UCD-KL20]|uniref:sensor domain-containing protein n=1 Tax=Colwellia sp. UCD-KL20 TaxID=1917165 RepID=UPI000970A666|nr:EAL domain-containing protein [Colwellia sp. UCD-KL20]